MDLFDIRLEDEIRGVADGTLANNRLRNECIIALKAYDTQRSQDCCTPLEIGPARAAEDTCIGDDFINEGEIIHAPYNATSVSVDKVKIKKIIIVDKKANCFRNGYWDIDIQYVFVYRITFREANGCKIGSVKANSTYNKKVTMFGSTGSELTLASDLFENFSNNGSTIEGEPYVLVEAKAIALSADIKYCHCKPHHKGHKHCNENDVEDTLDENSEVLVTIGLFSIIKVFRIVNLTVQSNGFCVPEEGDDIDPLDPCEFFDSLDFPLDVFCPPQKPEFFAGVSNNIPSENKCDKHHKKHHHNDCGCEPKHDECHDNHYDKKYKKGCNSCR
ncbi:MAG: hypothetical protein ACK5LY_07745 [Lachnospirales bacterium]